jgi:hypothetical protein
MPVIMWLPRGAGVMTTLRNTGVFAFAGATSTEFDSPLFEGARAENPAFILFVDRRLTPGLSLSSKMIFSRQITAIEGLDWAPADRLKIGFCGGVGANQPYGAASLDFRRKWITVQAAYIEREISSIARWWKRPCSANPTAKTRWSP